MAKAILWLWLGCLIVVSAVSAQTTLNPDFSVVGDFRAFSHNDPSRPTEKNEFNLKSPDMELMAAGYLNPYARADVVIAWEEGSNAEIEEVYATILRGLPLNMNLRVGKYRLEFGRLNSVHPHAYSFIYQPLPHQEFFSEEGLNDMALRTSFILPTGKLYTELMGAVLKGDIFSEEETPDAADSTAEEVHTKPGFFGRLTTSTAVSENAELTGGVSIVTADYDQIERLRATVFGIDMKYKWRPNRYRSLSIEGEALGNKRDREDTDAVTSYGGYGYIDYRFHQKYNVGSIFEYTQGKLDSDVSNSRMGGFIGFAPIEETSLVRLVGDWTTPSEGDGYWTATVQLIISLGPHQPHNF